MNPSGPFRVIVCELNTGIVCRRDGTRWLRDTHAAGEQYLEFATRDEALDFIRVSRETRPHLECNLYDWQRRHLQRFPSD